jgi:hypothetical protein
MEKNVKNPMDSEENKPFSHGGGKTKSNTGSNDPPAKVTVFLSCHESKNYTGTGHYAWSGCKMQETR